MTDHPGAEASLLLDDHSDLFTFETVSGMICLSITPEQMVEISKWAFTRKITHIILGQRTVNEDGTVRAISQGAEI